MDANVTVAILIEVFEQAFEFGWAQVLAVLFKNPLDFVAIKLRITVCVEASEQDLQVAHTVGTLGSKHLADFVEHLVGGLTDQAENGVYVRVVASSTESVHSCKLFEVEVARVVGVVFIENSGELVGLECAANCFKSILEFSRANNSTAVQVKVFEETLDSLSLVVGAVSALADLLKDYTLEFTHTSSWHGTLVGVKAPACTDSLSEVGVLFPGEDTVKIKVEIAEAFAVNLAVLNVGVNACTELLINLSSGLFTRGGSGVLSSSKLSMQITHHDTVGRSRDYLPSLHDDLFTFLGDVISQYSDELGIADGSILVKIKAIKDGAQLLGGEENAKSVQEFVELLLVKATIASFIVSLECALQLSYIVNTLCIQLELNLVKDLLSSVSPVCHFGCF